MDDCRRVIHGTMSPPTRRNVATWVNWAMVEMKSKVGIIRNAWLKTGYEWFPKEGGEEGNIIGGKEGIGGEEGTD